MYLTVVTPQPLVQLNANNKRRPGSIGGAPLHSWLLLFGRISRALRGVAGKCSLALVHHFVKLCSHVIPQERLVSDE